MSCDTLGFVYRFQYLGQHLGVYGRVVGTDLFMLIKCCRIISKKNDHSEQMWNIIWLNNLPENWDKNKHSLIEYFIKKEKKRLEKSKNETDSQFISDTNSSRRVILIFTVSLRIISVLCNIFFFSTSHFD